MRVVVPLKENIIFEQETWKFVNTFAPWFSAIGTISAVIVSLYLARRDKQVRLEVSAGHRLLASMGQPTPHPEYLSISIVNIGFREVQITNIGWKAGLFKKTYAVQTTIRDGYSSELPVRIKDGEEAKYFIPLWKQGKLNWLDDFITGFLQPNPKRAVKTLKIQVFTSIGKTFESFIEKGLQKKIVEHITKKQENKKS